MDFEHHVLLIHTFFIFLFFNGALGALISGAKRHQKGKKHSIKHERDRERGRICLTTNDASLTMKN